MTDSATLGLYDADAPAYAAFSEPPDPYPPLEAFLAGLPAAGRALDLGCGSGWAAARIARSGRAVDGLDASAGLAREAARRHGLEVRVGGFETLDAVALYDGVWAHFSLLHAPRAEMPAHLRRIRIALRSGGLLYLGLKEGEGERRDALGRFYAYHREAEIAALLAAAGFDAPEVQRRGGAGYDGARETFLHIWTRAGSETDG